MENKASRKPSVSIVIPCLNESETLSMCIEEAKLALEQAHLEGEILIADNGSTDGSQDIASKAGARVVPIVERGYGAAVHGGVMAARGDVVLMGDADMSYPFTALKDLIKPIIDNRAELVLGSRLRGTMEADAMPFLNRFLATPVLSFLIRRIYGLSTYDCNSGIRVFLKSSYLKLRLTSPGMEYASEMLIRAGQHGLKYTEIPIHFRKDRRSRPPHLKRWRDGWRHLRFILGNAPSAWFIVLPGGLASICVFFSLFLSFQRAWDPSAATRFHTALSLLVISLPLFVVSTTFLLVKAASSAGQARPSRLVVALDKWSENGTPFYLAVMLFALSGLQVILLMFKWKETGFSALNEIDGIIRAMAFSIVGSIVFSADLGMGLLKLINRQSKENH